MPSHIHVLKRSASQPITKREHKRIMSVHDANGRLQLLRLRLKQLRLLLKLLEIRLPAPTPIKKQEISNILR